jgi:hypothetical protein
MWPSLHRHASARGCTPAAQARCSCPHRPQLCRAGAAEPSSPSGASTSLPGPLDPANVPWQLAAYHSKKRLRVADKLGNLLNTPDTLLEPPAWTQDAKLTLALQVPGSAQHVGVLVA